MKNFTFLQQEKFHPLKILLWAVLFFIFAVLVFVFRVVYENSISKQASQSYTVSPLPTETTATTSSASPTPESAKPKTAQVLILDTPTGWLNVRSEPATTGDIVGKVNPMELHDIIQEKDSWYKIRFAGKEGWITSQYAKKQ